jgi:putative salt-induced outer membrane protein
MEPTKPVLPSLALASVCALVPMVAQAEQAGEDQPTADEQASESLPQISGDASLGALSSSGNTESESFNFGVEAEIAYAVWRHAVELAGYQASEDDETSAERYSAEAQSDYKFTLRNYLFVNANYLKDRFGAFEEQYAASIGVGRRFVDSQTVRLDLEIGAGRGVNDPQGPEEAFSESIGRFSGDLDWQFTEGVALTQSLDVESGDSNTYTESVTALKSRLTSAWSLRLSYTIQNNTEVGDDEEHTDRISTISLAYSF